MSALKSIKAYTKKELKESIRFKMGFFNTMLSPSITMVSFLVTYSAVFFSGAVNDLGYIDRSNYVIYLLTAFLVYTFFKLAWGRTNLNGEKFMLTLEGILLAPGSRLYILIGKASRILVEIFISVIFFVIALFFLHVSIDIKALIIGSISLILLFVILISVDFIISGIGLAKVGISSFISSYLPRGMALVGCAYYPIDVIPDFVKPLVYINPLYHAVNLFRIAFMRADLRFGWEVSFIYLLILAIIMPIIASVFFDWALKKWGIAGY